MRTLLFLMLASGVAVADTKAATYQAVAVKIATAHTCRDVTGDANAYDAAISEAPSRLKAAGYSDSEAQEKLQIIVSGLKSVDTKTITPQLCRDMLNLMR
jgi:hypothetical protein